MTTSQQESMMDQWELKYVYVLVWDTNNDSFWQPSFEKVLGVYSSRAAAVAALSTTDFSGVGHVGERIAEAIAEGWEPVDLRNAPSTVEEDREGVLLVRFGDDMEYDDVYLRELPLQD